MDRRHSNSAPDVAVFASLLLGNGNGSNNSNSSQESNGRSSFPRMAIIQGAARFLRNGSSRRIMREPSVLVRQTDAERSAERQSDWDYSSCFCPRYKLGTWHFFVVSDVVLILSSDENPNMPVRVWVVGYKLWCQLHTNCVCFEYRRRHSIISSRNSGNLGCNSGDQQSPSGCQDFESVNTDEEAEEEILAERTRFQTRKMLFGTGLLKLAGWKT